MFLGKSDWLFCLRYDEAMVGAESAGYGIGTHGRRQRAGLEDAGPSPWCHHSLLSHVPRRHLHQEPSLQAGGSPDLRRGPALGHTGMLYTIIQRNHFTLSAFDISYCHLHRIEVNCVTVHHHIVGISVNIISPLRMTI